MCGWAYVVSGSNPIDADVCYTQGSGQTSIGLYWDTSGGSPGILWRSAGAADYFELLSLSTWVHVGTTYDGTTLRHYRNGALVSSIAATLSTTLHDYVDVGVFDATAVIELAQVKYWAGYKLTTAEMLAEKGYKAPVAGQGFVRGHWQLENAAPLVDSSGNANTLAGLSGTGLQTEPDQPVGVTTLRSPSTLLPAGVQANRGAAVLTTSTKFLEGGVSSGMRNALSTLTSGTSVLAGGGVKRDGALVLTTASTLAVTGTSRLNASTTLVSGTQLVPIVGATVINGAVVLTTTTHLQVSGLIPKFGSVALTSGTHLQLAAAKKLNASTAFSTSTHLASVVQMAVGGAAQLRTASQISAYASISSVAPIWFADEPRATFTTHTPWTSNPSVSST